MRVAFPDTKKTYCFDAFPSNIDKISKITSPVLIIHGTEDEPVEPLWVEEQAINEWSFMDSTLNY
uniref:Peptidase S9 prolyl oligopeptidase catalytic domain-containing protein n=1 Tax=Gopherus evgoodei TaxID=1825980 RepID=A0A8C4Y3X6_9SAUR